MKINYNILSNANSYYNVYEFEARESNFYSSAKIYFNLSGTAREYENVYKHVLTPEESAGKCLGVYARLRQKNESRGFWNRFFHPFVNRKEKDTLKRMESYLKSTLHCNMTQINKIFGITKNHDYMSYTTIKDIDINGNVTKFEEPKVDNPNAELGNIVLDTEINVQPVTQINAKKTRQKVVNKVESNPETKKRKVLKDLGE